MHRFSAALVFVLALFPVAVPAQAATESGTPAYSTRALELSAGPGVNYATTGAIPAEAIIKVLRCQRLWCLVDGSGARGWTSIHFVDFGKPPVDLLPNPDRSGRGTVCFYTGANYTGESFCVPSGKTLEDLALLGQDNRFISLQIIGSTKLDACRDRFFQSYCELIEYSQPVMDQYLQRNLSSVKIY